MDRVFLELSPRRDEVAQLYGCGLEKKEIAARLCRSLSTVTTTIQRVYELLGVRNGRELSIKLAERMAGQDIRRTIIASCLVLLMTVDAIHEVQTMYRRGRCAEEVATVRRARRSEDLNPFES